MGRRGPKPLPVERLRLIGSKEAYEREGEVEIAPGEPVPPDWLTEGAADQWILMVERLRGMHVLSEWWREALGQFCAAWDEYQRLQVECQSATFVIPSKTGFVANPVFAMRDKAFDRVLKLGREFGYTPSSKTQVRTEQKPQQNKKSRFFGGA